jgi:hypothetical protein
MTNVVILVEDMEQQNLIFRFLERCRRTIRYRECRFETAAKRAGGSGEQFVRKQYPVEVKEYRRRIGKGASALLVTMIDADKETTQFRAKQLSDALQAAELDQRAAGEAIAILIPKRHVETWIRALRGLPVDEQTDYKNPKPASAEITDAAATLYSWTRAKAVPSTTCPPSLTDSVPEWRKADHQLNP